MLAKALIVELTDESGGVHRRALAFSTENAADNWIPEDFPGSFHYTGDGKWVFSALAMCPLIDLVLGGEDGKEVSRTRIISGTIQEIDLANPNTFKLLRRQ